MEEVKNGENVEEGDVQEEENRRINEKTEADKDLEEEEIIDAVKKMKVGKAAGIDEIPAEAYKYGGMVIRRELTELIRRVWQDNRISMEWRTSIVVLLYKRGDKEETKNYRGISLLYVQHTKYMQKY